MANKDPGGILPGGTVSFMEEIERIEMVEFGMEEDAQEVEKIQHDPTLSNAQRVNIRVRHDKKSCWSTLDEQEASLALKICPCTTCREHHYGGNARRAIYFFVVTLSLMWIFGAIIQTLESPLEIADNQAYVALMAKVKKNISTAVYEELMGFIGRDDKRGSENWVDYNEKDGSWAIDTKSTSNSAFYVFTLAATIGYGDFAPASNAGKWVSIIALLITIPMTVLVYVKLARIMFQGIIFIALSLNGGAITRAFQSCDDSGDGFIEYKELHLALRKLRIHLSEAEVISVMQTFDTDGDGVLDINEFQQIAINFDVDVNGMAIEKFKTRAVLILLLVWTLMFSTYFALIEKLTFLDGVWFALCTFTTIGLGDVTPSVEYRWIAVFFIFFGLGFVSMAIDAIVSNIRKSMERRQLELKKIERETTERRMKLIETGKASGLDKDGDGIITEAEWQEWEKIQEEQKLEGNVGNGINKQEWMHKTRRKSRIKQKWTTAAGKAMEMIHEKEIESSGGKDGVDDSGGKDGIDDGVVESINVRVEIEVEAEAEEPKMVALDLSALIEESESLIEIEMKNRI